MSESPRLTTPGPALTPLRLLVVLLVFYLLVQVKTIIFLCLLAILFATVIEGPVQRLERRGIPRAGAILLAYVALLAVLAVLLVAFVPIVRQETVEFAQQAPVIVNNLAESWRTSSNPILSGTGYRLLERLRFRVENPPTPPADTAFDVLGRVGATGLGLLSMFVIGFYWLMEKRLLRRLILGQFNDERATRLARLWEDVEAKVGDWLRGQLTLCMVIGVAAGVGYAVIGVRFWVLLALLAAITELIPIIGPWVGGIPAVMVALLDSWQKALIVAAFLLLLQFVENSILVPRIMKGAIGLSPLTVFVAVLAGGEFMGPLGALLAIPFAAGLQVIISDLIRERRRQLQLQAPDAETATGWREILGQFLPGERPRSETTAEPRRDARQPEEPGDVG